MPLHVVSYISHIVSTLLRVIHGLLYSETITHNKVVVDTIIFRCAVVYCTLEWAMHIRYQKL
jgi:hypothetical protein